MSGRMYRYPHRDYMIMDEVLDWAATLCELWHWEPSHHPKRPCPVVGLLAALDTDDAHGIEESIMRTISYAHAWDRSPAGLALERLRWAVMTGPRLREMSEQLAGWRELGIVS